MTKHRQVALRRPCSNCPFLDSDKSISHTLNEGRLDGIKEHLIGNDMNTFHCHKTLSGEWSYEGDYEHNGKESFCMGAMAWLYKQGRFNIAMRLAAMDKKWLEDLKASSILVIG